mmetsp:Transcript_77773/g.197604  ORF Transcript_77773/g.197604 Transcript_77773/m.197604 type:complete len:238 (+) Transcript_77773:269-982(+)
MDSIKDMRWRWSNPFRLDMRNATKLNSSRSTLPCASLTDLLSSFSAFKSLSLRNAICSSILLMVPSPSAKSHSTPVAPPACSLVLSMLSTFRRAGVPGDWGMFTPTSDNALTRFSISSRTLSKLSLTSFSNSAFSWSICSRCLASSRPISVSGCRHQAHTWSGSETICQGITMSSGTSKDLISTSSLSSLKPTMDFFFVGEGSSSGPSSPLDVPSKMIFSTSRRCRFGKKAMSWLNF